MERKDEKTPSSRVYSEEGGGGGEDSPSARIWGKGGGRTVALVALLGFSGG